jgi:MFS transporter, DHA1 family, tetracycline resistance protein
LQGALGSLQGVAGMIGPLLFTQVFAFALHSDGALHLPGAPYMLAAVLVALALYVAMRATRPRTVAARTEQSSA